MPAPSRTLGQHAGSHIRHSVRPCSHFFFFLLLYHKKHQSEQSMIKKSLGLYTGSGQAFCYYHCLGWPGWHMAQQDLYFQHRLVSTWSIQRGLSLLHHEQTHNIPTLHHTTQHTREDIGSIEQIPAIRGGDRDRNRTGQNRNRRPEGFQRSRSARLNPQGG